MKPLTSSQGIAYLVGAGPGDPGLVTLRARELVEQADVIVYDYLCNPAILAWARPDARVIYAGKKSRQHTLTQEQIHAVLLEEVRAGRCVVRLKGGDPFVFGRGGEEAEALAAAGLPFEIVPGVTSAIAAPAYAGIPATHRDLTSTVTFVTGHEDPEKPASALDWRALAQDAGTRIFLMGIERLPAIARTLLEKGASPETPAALVRWGTTPRQEVLEGTLGTIADLAARRGFRPPAVIVLGKVVELRRRLAWFERRPLFARRIVVTRTRQQASALSARLRALGADVLEIPTIRVSPVEAFPHDAALRAFVGRFDWLVFTSPNGVDAFFNMFWERHEDIRALGGVRLAAVGPATAARLEALHLQVDLTPRAFTTEALARAFSRALVEGRRVCLARGNLAQPALAEHLRASGASVEEWTVYRTDPATDDPFGARQRYLEEGADWITFTSSSTVENWHALGLSPAPGGRLPRFASIGPETTKAMQRLHFPIACEAAVSNLDGLVHAILDAEARPAA